jgi:hypothetical protein
MEDTLAQALDGACANLNRTAAELGAISAAVLINADKRTEIAHLWSIAGDEASGRVPIESLIRVDGAIDAGSLSAKVLRETISRNAHSFLAHLWQANRQAERQAVSIVLGYAGREPSLRRLPDAVAASLNLVALAFWSAREIARLRAELKTANERLAGRKLVEKAKGVLQLERGISEESAYEYLRGQSRRRRITLTKLAEEVVRVHGGFDRLPNHS